MTALPEGKELSGALTPWVGRGATVADLTLMSGGASRETWSFDMVGADGTRTALVLRRDPPGRPGDPGVYHREAQALTLAHEAGLAVPEMLVMSEGPGSGAPGLVMRRVAGQTIARKILRDDAYAGARQVLAAQLAAFAAGLHALPAPAGFPAPDPLADLRAQLDGFGRPSEVFELALSWLTAHPPPARAPVLVHGDFRLGNLVVGPDGLRAVLDWELTHAGNPAEDLGWLCVKAWRFGAGLPVAGLASRSDLLSAYRAAGGADISVGELRWWEVLGTLRWGVICLAQASVHLSGEHRSVELAAIGRRVCEQEWDLLLLLDPDAALAAAAGRPHVSGAGRPEPAPYGRPTTSELLEAVREFLTGRVMPATSGQLSFHARVAANALAIVSRELELGPPPWEGPGGPAQGGAETSVADLATAVAARLAVANPRYFGQHQPGRD